MADGVRLAARIWLPADPVSPAVLEYLPYRKNDGTAVADEGRHGWFAAHGYASIRVDLRGTGDSEGLLHDEYLVQEQDDAVAVIAWIAQQPWCSGRVGMMGYSWGGFNALQVAARRPPALAAIITMDSTDDRYADDVHYMGGCVLAYFMLSWAAQVHVYSVLPPDPDVVGTRWRQMWHDRLDAVTPVVGSWLGHQRRDEYWRHGSVCEDFGAIDIPVYAVSGWADGYRSAVFRLLAGLGAPRKGLIGPWSHTVPVEAQDPGPAIGFLQECLRWWDHWLRDVDTGIMDEPMLRVWMQDPVRPAPTYSERAGRWVSEPSWPSPNVAERRWHLGDGLLADTTQADVQLRHRGSQHHGLDSGNWDPMGDPADLAIDQRADDGRALTFTSAPLTEALELLGRPSLTLRVASDRPTAMVSARLCDVSEDGASYLLTSGLLNLNHHRGHHDPVSLVPGEQITAEVSMRAVGQVVPAGHRIRLSISTTLWPWAWPSPDVVELTVSTARSALRLPVRLTSPQPHLVPFAAPELAPRGQVEVLARQPGDHTISRSVAAGRVDFVHRYPTEHVRLPDSGIEVRRDDPDYFSVVEDEPLTATARSDRLYALERGEDFRARVESQSEMRADHDTYRVWTTLRAFDRDVCFFSRTWDFAIPRDHT